MKYLNRMILKTKLSIIFHIVLLVLAIPAWNNFVEKRSFEVYDKPYYDYSVVDKMDTKLSYSFDEAINKPASVVITAFESSINTKVYLKLEKGNRELYDRIYYSDGVETKRLIDSYESQDEEYLYFIIDENVIKNTKTVCDYIFWYEGVETNLKFPKHDFIVQVNI